MRRTILVSLLTLGLGALAGQAYAERQPHMKNALEHLEASLGALEKATADKGGHRVKAIALVKSAIEEVNKGIKFDEKH
jgi:hypothetical protein